MKIALIHDYLSQDGGAERVLKAMHEIWPEAPIFVLFHDQKKINYFNKDRIHESFLSKLPFIHSHFQWYLPFMPLATEKYHLEDFDVILSSTSSFAKGVIVKPDTLHVSYCHTPPRYLWSNTHEYVAELKYGQIIKFALPGIIHKLRMWDKMSADRVDHFIANSKTVQRRISKYYRRDSEVIYPPVDTDLFQISEKIDDFFLAGGRLVPYKKIDLIIKTFNRLQKPLKIFGVGPEYARLKNMAKKNIKFLGRISDEEKAKLMSTAQAFIHPQIEDFGITPVESMAAGRPVIAFSTGGATETVYHNETGIFFHKQNWETLFETLLSFNPQNWDSQKIREYALQFKTENFKNNLTNMVKSRLEEFQQGLNQPALRLPVTIAADIINSPLKQTLV